MNFRTEIDIKPHFPLMNHHSGVLMMGSCFTENIGGKIQRLKFPVLTNPFGISYNPVSILHQLKYIAGISEQASENIITREGRFYSYDFHSKINAKTKDELLGIINQNVQEALAFLQGAKYAFITPGTSVVYKRADSHSVVNNCQKQPSAIFNKEILTFQEVKQSIIEIIEVLKGIQPEIHICFTVSPVKHLRDGHELNSRSKSILISAIQEAIQETGGAFYFPAYEIQNDDLRDYRFYGSDLIHPSEQAVEYIFEKFSRVFFSDETRQINERIEKIQRLAAHRHLNPEAENLKSIGRQGLSLIQELESFILGLHFEHERNYFYSLIGE